MMQSQSLGSQAHYEVTHRASRLRSKRFLIGLLVALVFVAGFAWLARTVAYFPIDLQITRALQSIEAAPVQQLFHAVSWVGFPPQSNYIFGTVILALFLVGLRLEAVMTAFAAVGSAGLWFLLAPLIDRPRPSPELVRVAMELPTGGFPSGHALNLTAIFGFLIYLALVLLADVRWRVPVVAVLAIPVVFIGAARVYDGAHWASDVLGGYLIGGIWLALTIELYRLGGEWLESRRRAKDGASAEADRRGHAEYNSTHDGEISRPGDAPA
jgi:membrane-associated phospholipid phosphatase